MKEKKVLHIKKVENTDNIMEVIGAEFDGLNGLLYGKSIVFGGAVRDALAGLPIEGDLDLLVDFREAPHVIEMVEESIKWKTSPDLPQLNNYKNFKPLNTNIQDYVNTEGKRLQIIRAYNIETHLKEIDIICCGLFMNSSGEVFEAVPGAANDCINKVLRLNKGVKIKDFELLKVRIDKLIERGWTSEIDLEKVKKRCTKSRSKNRRINRRERTKTAVREKTKLKRIKEKGVGKATNSLYDVVRNNVIVKGGICVAIIQDLRLNKEKIKSKKITLSQSIGVPPQSIREAILLYNTLSITRTYMTPEDSEKIEGFSNSFDKMAKFVGRLRFKPDTSIEDCINITRRFIEIDNKIKNGENVKKVKTDGLVKGKTHVFSMNNANSKAIKV